MSVGIGRKSFIEFGSSVPITILNDYDNMFIDFGFDDPAYFSKDGSNNLTDIVDRGVVNTTFTMNGTIPYNSSLKAAKLTSSGFLTWLNTAFLKGPTLIVMAFRHKYDYTSWAGGGGSILYRDGAVYFSYPTNVQYTDNIWSSSNIDSVYRGKSIQEIGGHTICMWLCDGTTISYYVNNVLMASANISGSASDIRGLTGVFPFANNFPATTEMYLHRLRGYQKIYTSDERTTLYNWLVSTYALDLTNAPSASNLVINGTVSNGQTVTLSYTYNQNGGSAAGDFFVISGWYYNTTLMNYTPYYALKNLSITSGKKNDLTAVVPNQTGYYFYMLLVVYDDQNRTSKTLYRVNAQIV